MTDKFLLDLDQIAELYQGKVALFPANLLSFHALELPVKSAKQALTLAPVALEEQSNQDIEKLHTSVHKYQNQWFVWLCDADVLEHWLERLKQLNCQPKKLLPDYMVLPASESPCYCIEGQRAIVRLDQFRGFATHHDKLEFALSLAGLKLADVNHIETPFKTLFEQSKNVRSPINLLQGRYSTKTDISAVTRPWYWGVAASLLLILFYGSQLTLQNESLQQSINQQKQANVARFKAIFPKIEKVSNVRSQANQAFRKLKQLQDLQSTSLSALLNSGIPILQQNNQVKIEAITYHEYTLQLQMSAPSVGVAENVNNAFKALPGLEVTVQNLSQDGSLTKTTLSIRKAV